MVPGKLISHTWLTLRRPLIYTDSGKGNTRLRYAASWSLRWDNASKGLWTVPIVGDNVEGGPDVV